MNVREATQVYLELLAPAKNIEIGKAAINYGADAVYIGAQKFGAREAAGNSLTDIEELSKYAHRFNAKVFVTLNTILFDHELEDAEKLIHQIYDAGADALIVQDMGILEMNLPPISLHASTQTHNFDLERIKFMDEVGFDRIVLARELSAQQIQEVRKTVKADLEAFVHGALCVSLSGQCYMSHAIGGRSANRGACAQPCRKKYSLLDQDGKVIAKNQHLLSLKDLNLSESIAEMADAGVSSFKIEGRLKDIDYVKNVTAKYRQELDLLLEKHPEKYIKASSGKVNFDFQPDPANSFNRGATDYFFHGRHQEITNFDTPKALGKQIGKVTYTGKNFFELKEADLLNNNDGLVYFNKKRELEGIKVNRVDGKKVFVPSMKGLFQGAMLFRNSNHEFLKQLKSSRTARKISFDLEFSESDNGFALCAIDEDGKKVEKQFSMEKVPADNTERAEATLKKQLSKTGQSDFVLNQLTIETSRAWFLPAGQLNEMRRSIIELMEEKRDDYPRADFQFTPNDVPYPGTKADYSFNISNQLAETFYKRHGITEIEKAFELQEDYQGEILMTTKHCLKYALGFCPKYQDKKNSEAFSEPFYLQEGNLKFKLSFDCKRCVMNIISE